MNLKLNFPSKDKYVKFWNGVAFPISLTCATLFSYTAQSKLMDHGRFFRGISKVEWIGNYATLISYAVPFAEILVALLILIPWTNKIGLWCFLGTVIVFTVYIIIALLWAKNLPCRCGGVIETLSWNEHIWFNVFFIMLAIIAIRLKK